MNSHRQEHFPKEARAPVPGKGCLSWKRVAAHAHHSANRRAFPLSEGRGSALPEFTLCHFVKLSGLMAQESSLTQLLSAIMGSRKSQIIFISLKYCSPEIINQI